MAGSDVWQHMSGLAWLGNASYESLDITLILPDNYVNAGFRSKAGCLRMVGRGCDRGASDFLFLSCKLQEKIGGVRVQGLGF